MRWFEPGLPENRFSNAFWLLVVDGHENALRPISAKAA
jgi:hypothetical protein